MCRNVPKLIPDIICYYFYHISPSKRVDRVKHATFGSFSDFWWPLPRAKFEVYSTSEMLFSRLHMKIKCQGHVWVPSVRNGKKGPYTVKMTLKNFGFSTMQILGIFCSDLASSYYKYPPKWNFAHIETEGDVQDY